MITGICGSESNHKNSFQALAHILSTNISLATVIHLAKHKVRGNDICHTIVKEVIEKSLAKFMATGMVKNSSH